MIFLFSYNWWPISRWSPEWVGAIGTILTIWYSVRFYNKDKKFNFVMYVESGVKERTDNIKSYGNGITIHGFNDSSMAAMIQFVGLAIKRNYFLERLLIVINYLMQKNIFKTQMLWAISHVLGMTVNSKGEDIDFKFPFVKVDPYSEIETITYSQKELVEEIEKLAKNNKKVIKKLKKRKPLKISILFMKHDGLYYRTGIRFVDHVTVGGAEYKDPIYLSLVNKIIYNA
ncbi:hypothetical protein [Pediococcus claussenii]|uniref:hypothetical protein n=1 Tax=Pediococcus claussenii TaxID=187452 RepID=UPI00081A825F|nr:hypothetical protein [Pediococcus claussenii]ANZ70362.1 hypothetical protein AYR57_08555 [Pediococcus claussenii]ANZ72178.1 hypothetical protein AYR58_08555 [Pediococcus claussenii]